uniref:Secreted protein n=1 Tax=Plectus sambesii TaxID=2011161 RepID=A0A914XH93_9BILA
MRHKNTAPRVIRSALCPGCLLFVALSSGKQKTTTASRGAQQMAHDTRPQYPRGRVAVLAAWGRKRDEKEASVIERQAPDRLSRDGPRESNAEKEMNHRGGDGVVNGVFAGAS